jgi:hypothetical protein
MESYAYMSIVILTVQMTLILSLCCSIDVNTCITVDMMAERHEPKTQRLFA